MNADQGKPSVCPKCGSIYKDWVKDECVGEHDPWHDGGSSPVPAATTITGNLPAEFVMRVFINCELRHSVLGGHFELRRQIDRAQSAWALRGKQAEVRRTSPDELHIVIGSQQIRFWIEESL